MQKTPSMLTRKVGPLPLYGYALLALAAWFLLFHGAPAKASGGNGLPYTPASGSGAQQPASGQGNAADNGNADLLSALGDNKLSYDALLNALQGSGGYGVAGGGAGGASGDGASTAAVTAPTIDSGTNNAPVDTSPYISSTPPPYSPTNPTYIVPGVDGAGRYFQPPGYFQNEQGYGIYQGGMPFGGLDPAIATAIQTQQQVTAPTTFAMVSPAPVDTTSATVAPTPRPTPGHNVAV